MDGAVLANRILVVLEAVRQYQRGLRKW